MERTYYTLDDIRKELGGNYASGAGPYSLKTISFSDFLIDCLVKADFSRRPGTNTETAEANTCFHDYIWPRFYQEAIIYVDSDESESFVGKFARTKVGQIFA